MTRARIPVGRFLVLIALAAVTAVTAAPAPMSYAVTGDVDLMHPKGATQKPPAATDSNVNMTFHGGPIMPTAVTKAIFWGPKWASSTFVADKMTGLDSFYKGYSGSRYAATSNEYTGTNGKVGATTTYQGHLVDTSTASSGDAPNDILGEVAKQVQAGAIVLNSSGNSYIAVYTDLPRGDSGFCAWHSAGTVNGTRVEFAFFWSLDNDVSCDPGDKATGHSQGVAALANVSAHELSEARTDPASPGGWYDATGWENGDLCSWSFNSASVTFSNGSKWKLQGEWSNAAFKAGTGYAGITGQRGCVDGH